MCGRLADGSFETRGLGRGQRTRNAWSSQILVVASHFISRGLRARLLSLYDTDAKIHFLFRDAQPGLAMDAAL